MRVSSRTARQMILAGTAPDNLTVGGSLDLRDTAITALGRNVTVGSSLDLSGTAITALPDNLTVGGSLDLSGTAITALPDNLTVGCWLDLSGTAITALGRNVTVGGLPIATPEQAAPRIREIAEIVLANPSLLKMSDWHCGTSHCLAGWAEHLAAQRGDIVPDGSIETATYGLHLLGLEAAKHFYMNDETALNWLRAQVAA